MHRAQELVIPDPFHCLFRVRSPSSDLWLLLVKATPILIYIVASHYLIELGSDRRWG